MKVLHLTKKFPNVLGGDAIVVNNLVAEQIKKHKVIVITSKCKEISDKNFVVKVGLSCTPESLDHINIQRLLSLAIIFLQSFYIIYRYRPNVIHAHGVDLACVFNMAAKLYRIPIVLTLHTGSFNNNRDLTRKYLERILIKIFKFNIITTVNPKDSTTNKNLIYIPNSVDTNKFKKNYTKKDNSVLYVGRFEEEKGVIVLLNAYKKISYKIPNTTLRFIGTGTLLNELKKESTQNVYKIDVIDYATQEILPYYYNKATVTVLPSTIIEGFGITLLESLSCSTPVITTDIVGSASLIQKNGVGKVIKPNNLYELEKALLYFLKDNSCVTKMGYKGRKYVNKLYDWKKICNKYDNIYKQATL